MRRGRSIAFGHNPLAPPSQAKTRVYVKAYSGNGVFGRCHSKNLRGDQRELAESYLLEIGPSEIVSTKDIKAILGDQEVSSRQMEQNNWKMARETGKALYSDYVLIVGRYEWDDKDFFYTTLINVETGENFGRMILLAPLTLRARLLSAQMQNAAIIVPALDIQK